ncbi:MAG: heavy metal-binding domain-containing protein [bacterium]
MKQPVLAATMVVAAILFGTWSAQAASPGKTKVVAPAPDAAKPAAAPAAASGGAGTQAPLHGGLVASTKDARFETVLSGGRLFVYAYTPAGSPATMHSAAGTATFHLPDGTTKDVALAKETPAAGEPAIYFCPMHASVVRDAPGVCPLCGGMKLYTQDRLAGSVDLPKLPATGVEASIRVGDPKETVVAFTQTLGAAVAPAKKGVAPAKPDGARKKGVTPTAH